MTSCVGSTVVCALDKRPELKNDVLQNFIDIGRGSVKRRYLSDYNLSKFELTESEDAGVQQSTGFIIQDYDSSVSTVIDSTRHVRLDMFHTLGKDSDYESTLLKLNDGNVNGAAFDYLVSKNILNEVSEGCCATLVIQSSRINVFVYNRSDAPIEVWYTYLDGVPLLVWSTSEKLQKATKELMGSKYGDNQFWHKLISINPGYAWKLQPDYVFDKYLRRKSLLKNSLFLVNWLEKYSTSKLFKPNETVK